MSARFVRMDGGWINLDMVSGITEGPNGKTVFRNAEGENIGERPSWWSFDPDKYIPSLVVPAASGSMAIVMEGLSGEKDRRPTEVSTESVPIAAWKIIDGVAEPIFARSHSEETEVFICMSNGRLMSSCGYIYDDLASAKKATLSEFQSNWSQNVRDPVWRKKHGLPVEAEHDVTA